jgi:hypothetical protein
MIFNGGLSTTAEPAVRTARGQTARTAGATIALDVSEAAVIRALDIAAGIAGAASPVELVRGAGRKVARHRVLPSWKRGKRQCTSSPSPSTIVTGRIAFTQQPSTRLVSAPE